MYYEGQCRGIVAHLFSITYWLILLVGSRSHFLLHLLLHFFKSWAVCIYSSMLRNTSLFCRSHAAFWVGVIKRHTEFQFVLRGSTLSFVSPTSHLSSLSDCWPCRLQAQHYMQKQQTYMDCLNSSHDYKRPKPYNKHVPISLIVVYFLDQILI